MNTPSSIPPEAPESLVIHAEPRAPAAWQTALAGLWHDRVLQILIALVLLVNLALFAYLTLRFANLPDLLPLHFDSAGLPDRIDSKNNVFALPVIGVTVWFLNVGLSVLLHSRERAAAILLTLGALFVQILLWLAILNIAGLV